jgi:DNA-binding SARP family transcriptional activator
VRQYQAWELLAYLATHGGSVSRLEVLDTFWPGADDASVGNRLDQLVFRLKKVLTAQAGEGARDLLCRERGKLAFDAAVVASDVQRFQALLDAAVSLTSDELLAGSEYAWLEQPGEDGLTLRERYQEQAARLTHELACRLRDGGEPDRAAALFRKLLDDQPTLRPAARGLYRCYAILKDQQALEQAHARLVAALKRERAIAGTDGADVALHPKTISAYRKALDEIQKQQGTEGSTT